MSGLGILGPFAHQFIVISRIRLLISQPIGKIYGQSFGNSVPHVFVKIVIMSLQSGKQLIQKAFGLNQNGPVTALFMQSPQCVPGTGGLLGQHRHRIKSQRQILVHQL